MTLYTRPQLGILLVVVAVAGVGLGVGHWRRAHPELAARLESFDWTAPPTPPPSGRPPPAASRTRTEWTSRRTEPVKRAPPARPIEVNHASEDELRALPGIGAVLAARIVEARQRDGPFASLDDLRRVRGLGRAKLERLAAAIALGP
jgi:competence ComEA-like helix-hairpin-helix protein